MSLRDPRWCARLRGSGDPPPPRRRIVDRADFDPSFDPSAPILCEICGHAMAYTGSCKIRCGVCGYQRDCSDP